MQSWETFLHTSNLHLDVWLKGFKIAVPGMLSTRTLYVHLGVPNGAKICIMFFELWAINLDLYSKLNGRIDCMQWRHTCFILLKKKISCLTEIPEMKHSLTEQCLIIISLKDLIITTLNIRLILKDTWKLDCYLWQMSAADE